MVWLPLQMVTDNIGMSLSYLMPLLLFICSLTFFAVNFKLGLVLSFLTNFLLFIWFYEMGINYVPPLVLGFVMLVMMAFSLYMVHDRDAGGNIA